MNKLNLKWVSDTIGDEYKQWKKGDVITIQAQTGTGKTYFIKNQLISNMDIHERMLILANRINLKRQLKKDLLKNMRRPIPKDIKVLDSMTTFDNVVIMSYQQIDNLAHAREYGLTSLNLGRYDYIVLDESHYIFADSGFNNKTDYSFRELVIRRHSNSIKIFISATMEELKPTINKAVKDIKSDITVKDRCELWNYTTGKDYSYVDTKYFKSVDDIAITIKNDESKEKWIVFVTKIEDAKYIAEKIEGYKTTTIITKDTTKNDDLTEIINNSRFKSQVLLCTKCLDNGINIEDECVKNIVIMAWDRITFIQELGRIRQNIEKPYEVNLYIQKKSKKSFTTLINKVYEPKRNMIKEYNGEIKKNKTEEEQKDALNLFKSKYNRGMDKLYDDIFYLDRENEWKININGLTRLVKDMEFAKYMEEKFENDSNFAFIKEQLSWIELENTFSKEKLIENVIDIEEVNSLEKWLDENKDKRLYAAQQQELSDLIIKELTTINSSIDYRTKRLKPTTIKYLLNEQLHLSYEVSKPKREDRIVSGKRITKSYIIISNIN